MFSASLNLGYTRTRALKCWGEKDWIIKDIIHPNFTEEWAEMIYRQLKIQQVTSPYQNVKKIYSAFFLVKLPEINLKQWDQYMLI